MQDEILIKRLSIIKLLYQIGLEQSKQYESIAFFSILSFHDSIEMFLKLACETKQIKSDGLSFIEYWEKLPFLTLKESMRSFNARRVNLKHKGLIPAKIEIETSRVNTKQFFEQNTETTFGIKFSEISLFELIKFDKPKLLLVTAEQHFKKQEFQKSFLKIVESFEELLLEYKSNKIRWNAGNLFDFSNKISIERYSSWSDKDGKDKRLDEVVNKLNEKFEEVERALEIISYGFDFRKYSKFKMCSPKLYRESSGKYQFYNFQNRIKFNKENCEFGMSFVLECCLKLQEFDYENPNLD